MPFPTVHARLQFLPHPVQRFINRAFLPTVYNALRSDDCVLRFHTGDFSHESNPGQMFAWIAPRAPGRRGREAGKGRTAWRSHYWLHATIAMNAAHTTAIAMYSDLVTRHHPNQVRKHLANITNPLKKATNPHAANKITPVTISHSGAPRALYAMKINKPRPPQAAADACVQSHVRSSVMICRFTQRHSARTSHRERTRR